MHTTPTHTPTHSHTCRYIDHTKPRQHHVIVVIMRCRIMAKDAKNCQRLAAGGGKPLIHRTIQTFRLLFFFSIKIVSPYFVLLLNVIGGFRYPLSILSSISLVHDEIVHDIFYTVVSY